MFQEIYEEDFLYYDPYRCIGDLGEKWCNFRWRIYNIHLNPKMKFQSPVFTTRLLPNTHWYMEVELSVPGDLRTLKISLNRLQNHEKIILGVDFSYKIIWDENVAMCGINLFEFNNDMRWVETHGYSVSFYKPKANYVTIECKLRPNKRMIQDVCHRNLDNSLPISLRWLLQTGELFDTIIHVGENRLIAHIAILNARLPELLEKCRAPTKENGKHIVNINDVDLPVVKEMLKYAYTGQAYLDVQSSPVSKDVYASYSRNFIQNFCWEDHPFAKTFFNYETDSLSWHLKDVFKKSNLGSQSIYLLRLYPSEFTFSLDVDESEKDEKWLLLTFQFLQYEIPKPTIVSCNALLVNRENNETLELGETEYLVEYSKTKGKIKLCSILDVKKGGETIRATDDSLILQTDLKFGYGSYKSSIENLYEGPFDLSKCTGCPQLSADMEHLYRSCNYSNIYVESGDKKQIRAHKAILLARWPAADRLEVIQNNYVFIAEHEYKDLYNFILQLYRGFA